MATQESETRRVEAFSDGIFAVAITLLVLDVHVPALKEFPPGGLGQALSAQWPMYLAYVTSFATILIMWTNHDRLFEHIQRKDRGMVLLNGLLLMVITLIPFPTALLAEYIERPDAKLAAAIFCGNYFLMAGAFNLLWRYAARDGRLLAPDHDRRKAQKITEQFRFGPLLYVVIFAVAFFSATAALVLTLAVAVFFALPDKPDPEAAG